MTYFVRIPARFRRSKKTARLAPIWTFDNEVDAIDFAKTFEVCWVEVTFDNKVIFKNYSTAKWMSEAEALIVKQQNASSGLERTEVYTKNKKRGAV